MSFILANGIKLHVQELNEDADSVIIMIHGILVGNLAMWYFTAAQALAVKHRVIMYDLRGHGRSEKTKTGYDIGNQTQDLSDLIESIKPGNLSFVGHSFGALLALRYTLNHPKRIHKLCLIEAPLSIKSADILRSQMQKPPTEYLEMLPQKMQELLSQGNRQIMHQIRRMGYLVTQTSLVEDMNKPIGFNEGDLEDLEHPTLIIYGNHSPCIDSSYKIEDSMQNIQTHRIEGGHYLPIEKSRDMTRIMEQFFNR